METFMKSHLAFLSFLNVGGYMVNIIGTFLQLSLRTPGIVLVK
jgi:hypothetical protein